MNILILAWKHCYGELYLHSFFYSLLMESHTAVHIFPYCFWSLMSQAVHVRLAGSIHVLCSFIKPRFHTFSVPCSQLSLLCKKVCPDLLLAEKLKVRMLWLPGPNQICRISIMEWQRSSWMAKGQAEAFRAGQMFSSRNLFPSPSAVRTSTWPSTCQASCALGKLLVSGSTCLCLLLCCYWHLSFGLLLQ